MRIRTYKPKKKFELREGDTFPVLVDVGRTFAGLGGIISFFVSSLILSIRSFFKTRRKVREVISKHQKIYDLR